MTKENLQTDYANTLLKYKPGKGWSPMDYTSAADESTHTDHASPSPEQLAKPVANPAVAKVIPMPAPVGASHAESSPVSSAQARPATNANHTSQTQRGGNATPEQAQLNSWLEQAARSPDHFSMQDMASASLETLSQRLPELFGPLDQYADEAGVLSWDDVAGHIAAAEATMQERDHLAGLLAQADARLTTIKRELYTQLHDIQRQERTKAAAAQLRERMSAHTAQQVAKRLRHLLAK